MQHDTKYYYEIGDGDSSRRFWFQTPPEVDPDASYTFGIIGEFIFYVNSIVSDTILERSQAVGHIVIPFLVSIELLVAFKALTDSFIIALDSASSWILLHVSKTDLLILLTFE